MEKYKFIKKISLIGFLSCLMISLFNCEIQDDFTYKKSEYSGKLGISAWEFIQNSDSLELFSQAIKKVELQEYYNNEGEKTFIAPTNEAFKVYLEENGYASINDIPNPILLNMLKYHIVNGRVIFTDPDLSESNRPWAYETENGQTMYLSHNTSWEGIINQGTSKQFSISTSNLEATNGIIHVVPSVVYYSAPSTGDTEISDGDVVKDTIFPIADTYVNGGNQSGTNFGSANLLLLKNTEADGGLYMRKPFLMFDLNQIKKEGIVTDLKLSLDVRFTHGKGVGIHLYAVEDTTWTEMGLTYNNAPFPDTDPIARLTSAKLEKFEFDVTDYYNNLGGKQRVSFMLDADPGSDETDEFGSKENKDLQSPMLIAILGSGDNTLEIAKNVGINVDSGGSAVLSKDELQVEGASANDIIFTVVEPPQHGWLIKGANVLKEGDKFTQGDINALNLLYINDESGTQDEIVLTGKDRTGAFLEAFSVKIAIH